MSSNSANNLAGLTPGECLRLLVEHRRKWLLPTIVCGGLALCYAMFMSRYWQASQGLVVRREVSASLVKDPGKFADLYEMRTFQETILELVKSPQVLSETLKTVEQVETGRVAAEPSAEEIDILRGRIQMTPPGGAEFGKTEIFYLQAKDTDRERAIQLVSALCEHLDKRLSRLRSEQSQSLVDELTEQVALAESSLEAETERLAAFEAEVGADLGELRMLNASNSGQSDLRQQSVNLNNERLAAAIRLRESEQLLVLLKKALLEPDQLIAMPNSLLTSQPTLSRLKDGFVDAQLRAAQLEGTRTADHPQVQAAVLSLKYIQEDLHKELEVAIRGVGVETELIRNRIASLQERHDEVLWRLQRLAGLRASYENHMTAVENSRGVLSQAQKQLGEVSSVHVAANSVSLVTPIDRPDTGAYPVGMGRSSVVVLGTFGGFALGLGWLFLTVMPKSEESKAVSLNADAEAVEPVAVKPEVAAEPLGNRVTSNLSPAVAEKIAAIVAARKQAMSTSNGVQN